MWFCFVCEKHTKIHCKNIKYLTNIDKIDLGHYHPLTLYGYQVCKQADTVLSHFIFEDYQSLDTIGNSFDYYEKITTHDSSLSRCIFSIVASKLGLADKAYDYFGDSAKLDLFNTHKNTKDGIHTASRGGNYMAIVYGFAGLRIKEEGVYVSPLISKQWEEYRFKINYEDSQIMLEIDKKLLMEMSHEDLRDEVKSTLDNLRKLGLKLAIGSLSRNARLILSRIGLEDFFDGISDGNNIEKYAL